MITLIIGPMWSSKTKTMLNFVERFVYAKKKCVVLKYAKDTRYASSDENITTIITHDKIEYSFCSMFKVNSLLEVDDYIREEKIDVIGIDEVQFIKNHEILYDWANLNIHIYAAGLNGDFRQKPFDVISSLIPNVDNIIKLNAVCMKCFNNEASFTIRISNDKEIEIIGGDKLYMSVCRKCLSKK